MTIDRTGCPGRAPHGTATAWTKRGCRCPDAHEANRLARSTGTRRRLEALAALGHPAVVICTHMGIAPRSARTLVSSWRDPRRRWVHRRTADATTTAFDALSGTPGRSATARMRALRGGCAPPHAWDGIDIDDPDARPDFGPPNSTLPDEVAIERVIAGHARLDSLEHTAHRRVVVARLGARGWSVAEIADWVQASERAIDRHRAAIAHDSRRTPKADADEGEAA